MVSLPSLPTDNLYKFMAVTGLVLFLTSQVAPFLANRTKIDRFRAEADTLIEFVTDANQRVHTLNNEFSQTRLNTEKWTEAALAEDKFRLGNLSRATSAITGIGEAKVKLLGLSLQATEVETTTQFAVLRNRAATSSR